MGTSTSSPSPTQLVLQKCLVFLSHSLVLPAESPMTVSHPPPQTSASTSDLSRGPHLPLRREIAVFRQNFPACPSQSPPAHGLSPSSSTPSCFSQGHRCHLSPRMGSRTFLQPSSNFSWLQGKQKQHHSPPSSPVAALPPSSSSPAKCLERLGATSVLYFIPPTLSSAPLQYGFLPRPWEAALHSAQAGGVGGNRPPFVNALPPHSWLFPLWASLTPYPWLFWLLPGPLC